MLERTFGRGLSGSFEALFFPLIANRLIDLIEGEIFLPFVAVAGVVAGAGAVQAEKAGQTIQTQFAIMVSAPESARSLLDQTILCGQKRIDVCRCCRCEMECIKWTITQADQDLRSTNGDFVNLYRGGCEIYFNPRQRWLRPPKSFLQIGEMNEQQPTAKKTLSPCSVPPQVFFLITTAGF